ncbi:MAG: tetratricopeptide repeat protein [Anaerolineae bacterium]|nr:tetratricopeptide repeat protein [Anaerolineae bacterium]
MPALHIRLLGGLALAWGDAPRPPIPGAAARSLFAYLATYRHRPHTRDLLAGTFCPDLPDDVARRRLSHALWQIRTTLTPHAVLLTEGNAVQLHPELPVWIDVEQFTMHYAQCIQGGADALEQGALCVEHYTGDFLAGYYDDWLLVERERLHEMFLGVLEQMGEGLKARREYERALAYARRLAGEDPLREDAHCEVMRLCHVLGRDGEALQQYALCCQVLADELATQPSATTIALADEIAAQAREARVPHLPLVPHIHPVSLVGQPHRIPLVGREAERAELACHLEQAMDGRGGLLLLAGSAGVGKTRLVQELARDAAWRGCTVLWGHCCELSAPVPYQPLVEALQAADLDPLPAAWRGELARLVPGWAPPPPAMEPGQARARLLEALAQAFLTLGHHGPDRTTPHLVILEDVHWIDPASFEALRVLLPRLPHSYLLMVGTLRPEELEEQPLIHQALARLAATHIPQQIELAPLTEVETASLIQRALGLAQPAPHFSRRLFTQTEGNPFFLTETLRLLVDEGLLYRDEAGDWQTPWDQASNRYAEMPIPRSIAQGIEQRVARLSPPAQDLLGIAAVIGRRVAFDLWLAASGEEEELLLDAADELVRRGLLADTQDLVGYCFVHETTRQLVYGRSSPARRRRWHRRVAGTLEALHPDQVEALAHHYALGQNWAQAVVYARQAGERAQAVYAHQQALDHFYNADTWLAEGRVSMPADELDCWRADLAEKRGQVYNFMGEYERAEAAFSQAHRLWVDLGDWRSAARVLNRLSFLYFLRYDYARASHYARLALAAMPEETPPPGLQATSLTYLGLSAWTEGRSDEALPPLHQALALFEEIGSDPYGLARCLNSLGLVHLERGNFAEAASYFARSLALRQQIGDLRGTAWCWHNLGRMALAQGDPAIARERLETARSIFAEIEHPDGLDTCARTLVRVHQAEAAAHGAGRPRGASARLPRADAPLGRPLRDDEYVVVSWAVDRPDDAAIPHKVDRRRHRLLRLLAEAQSQGAVPAYHHLADALGVSERTVERDMAALRQEHPDLPPTRRKMSE